MRSCLGAFGPRTMALCSLLALCFSTTGCVITRDRDVSSLNFPAAPPVAGSEGASAAATTVAYEAPAPSQAKGSSSPWVALPSDDGCLPSCRPHADSPGGNAPRAAEPNLLPPAQQTRSQTAEANCAECDRRQQSLSQQAEDIETRLNSRIGRLENQLKESMAQTEELRTLLMKSSQETVRLQHEVMECKGTIAQMQADFKRQQLEDLKALESLSNSLRTVLTAEAEQDSSEVNR